MTRRRRRGGFGDGSTDAVERAECVLLFVGCLNSIGSTVRVGWSKNEAFEIWSGWALAGWWKVGQGIPGQLTTMVDAHVARLSILEVAGCAPPTFELGISPIPTSASLLVEA